MALAPVLRRLPVLENLFLEGNPFGNEGLATLVAPPPPTGALSTPTGVLKKLKMLILCETQVADAGCAALAAALDSGALPSLKNLDLRHIPASAAAEAALKARIPAGSDCDVYCDDDYDSEESLV